jgi:large subunit ribosomal protein L22
METIVAKLKYMRISHRKSRLAANTLKGLSAQEAEAQLFVMPHRSRDYLLRLLRSAIANAKHNNKIEVERLFIKEIRVDGGPMTKRWTPRARGSASKIEKKTSHVTIVLGVRDEPVAKKYNIVPAKKKEVEKPKKKKTTEDAKKHVATDSATNTEKPKEKRSSGPKIFSRKAI